MQNDRRHLLRGLAFLIVLGLIVWSLQGLFGLDSVRSYENERGFSEEKDSSLDAVYIGGSDVHAFWQPLFGYKDRGIAVWNYSIDSLPMAAVKYLVAETRKSQPQALFIISLSTFKKESPESSMVDLHRIVDYQPFSLNKIETINRLTEDAQISGLDKLEFYFPIIRFHSRWDSLGKWALGAVDEDYKASMHTDAFRKTVLDLTKSFRTTSERTELPEAVEGILNEFLDYCDEEQLNVLFVKVPQATTMAALKRMNTMEDMVAARGYPCLDLLEQIDDYGIDLQNDFYNKSHTNVHGSLKYSPYLADYLTEHYEFSDKRGTKGWESWDNALAGYKDYLADAVLPFELEDSLRDYGLTAPKLQKIKVEDHTLTLGWEASENADGYAIFRLCPSKENRWSEIAAVGADTLAYTDFNLNAQTTYSYRVVPFKKADGERAFGNFDANGQSGKTGGEQ